MLNQARKDRESEEENYEEKHWDIVNAQAMMVEEMAKHLRPFYIDTEFDEGGVTLTMNMRNVSVSYGARVEITKEEPHGTVDIEYDPSKGIAEVRIDYGNVEKVFEFDDVEFSMDIKNGKIEIVIGLDDYSKIIPHEYRRHIFSNTMRWPY